MKIEDIRASVLRCPVRIRPLDHPVDRFEIVFCETDRLGPEPDGNGVRAARGHR